MFKCEFPGCCYETAYRSQINFHHIKPKELGGDDKKSNLIHLCPTHHTKVYVEGTTAGIHTIQGSDSIILRGWLQSTGGKVLEYIDENGNTQYHGVGK